MKAFIESQFSYCPLIWMFHSRNLNNKINKIHERSLRIVYNDDTSSFDELLRKDNSVSIHHRNIQALAIEMYKAKNNLSPKITQGIFKLRNSPYNMRSQHDFVLPRSTTANYGTESLRFMGPKIWNILPETLEEVPSLYKFKLEVKHWIPTDCPCKLCKMYILNVGYIDQSLQCYSFYIILIIIRY